MTLSSDLAFVLEDDIGVCGYVLAALDSSQFYQEFRSIWLPQMKAKYPVVSPSIEQLSPEKVHLLYTQYLIQWNPFGINFSRCPKFSRICRFCLLLGHMQVSIFEKLMSLLHD